MARSSQGIVSLLEIGCGSGFCIKYAANRNPSLSAVRVIIEVGDIRLKAPDECFSAVTLYNNIYYFPVESRVSLLQLA
jgi:tRNA G46 methylase TrmB